VINKKIKFVAQSNEMKQVLEKVKSVANSNTSVLLMGETGSGKDLLAHMIHNMSERKESQMVKINCAAIPSTLIESELFGYQEGAFTGASSLKIGRFEYANGATIFLDEIGDLSRDTQGKFLRVIHDGSFERLGSSETIKLDIRIITSTNKDLPKLVREGLFRDDLFYRLNVFPINIPPLREHTYDIPALVWTFIEEFEKSMGITIESVPIEIMTALRMYSWPGNIRELKNVIERGMILSDGKSLRLELPDTKSLQVDTLPKLEDVERKYILEVLNVTKWKIRGEKGASEILGLKPTTLESRMVRLGIKRIV